MKKYAFLLLAALLLMLCVHASADEQTYTYGDFTYALLNDGGAELVAYNGPEGDVIIPNTLDGHPVTAVKGNLFYSAVFDKVLDCRVSVSKDHPYLATIDGVLFGKTDRKLIYCPPSMEGEYYIPQGIISVGDYAFDGCTKLTEIMIPDSVTYIGQYAFLGCSGITSMTIPYTVEWIEGGAFANCSDLLEINMQKEAIDDEPSVERVIAYEGYASLDGVLYSKSMGSIISYPAGKTEESFTIPSQVKTIATSAFDGCANLKSVIIPDGVREIGHFAFYQCTGLTEIVLPNTVTSIGLLSFADCTHLSHITLSENLSRIEVGAFMNCISLTNVVIPDEVTSIGEIAFSGCSFLTKIEISDSVTYIGGGAFSECPFLTVVASRDSYAEKYCKENGLTILYPAFAYQKLSDGTIEITHYDGTDSAVVIPEEIDGYRITGIVSGAFSETPYVISIDIPDTVVYIGYSHTVSEVVEALPEIAEAVVEVLPEIAEAAVEPTATPTPSPILTKGVFRGCSKDLVITCGLGSYAARYCEENGIPFVIREQEYADDDSWLN